MRSMFIIIMSSHVIHELNQSSHIQYKATKGLQPHAVCCRDRERERKRKRKRLRVEGAPESKHEINTAEMRL